MEEFFDKVAVFLEGRGEQSLGEEYLSFGGLLTEATKLRTSIYVQYVESALSYALSFLSLADAGVSQGKSPEALRKVIFEQMGLLTSKVDGLDESMIQPQLLEAAKGQQG